MKIAILAARILLGLAFFASGLVQVLNLLKPQPMPGDAGVFIMILTVHKYTVFIGLLDLIAGLLLMVGRFVPLALVLLGPILVNILLFHALLMPQGAAGGIVLTVLEIFLIFIYRKSFRGLFDAAPEVWPAPAGKV